MLTARFALMCPVRVDELVVVNAVRLGDYTAKGVPYVTIDETVHTEAASTYESIPGYEQEKYYVVK